MFLEPRQLHNLTEQPNFISLRDTFDADLTRRVKGEVLDDPGSDQAGAPTEAKKKRRDKRKAD